MVDQKNTSILPKRRYPVRTGIELQTQYCSGNGSLEREWPWKRHDCELCDRHTQASRGTNRPRSVGRGGTLSRTKERAAGTSVTTRKRRRGRVRSAAGKQLTGKINYAPLRFELCVILATNGTSGWKPGCSGELSIPPPTRPCARGMGCFWH